MVCTLLKYNKVIKFNIILQIIHNAYYASILQTYCLWLNSQKYHKFPNIENNSISKNNNDKEQINSILICFPFAC